MQRHPEFGSDNALPLGAALNAYEAARIARSIDAMVEREDDDERPARATGRRRTAASAQGKR